MYCCLTRKMNFHRILMNFVWYFYPKNHGISKLVVLDIPNPFEKHIQTPLKSQGYYRDSQGFRLLNFQTHQMGVSKNSGTPKSSILIRFSVIFTIQFGVLYPYFWKHPKSPSATLNRNDVNDNCLRRQDRNMLHEQFLAMDRQKRGAFFILFLFLEVGLILAMKKSWLFRVWRRLYYPVMQGL